MSTEGNLLYCRNCGKTGPHNGNGWYQLSVDDPNTARSYRWLGVFCCMRCLAKQIPTMASIEGEIRTRTQL